jgi:hypothetical protein
MIVRISRSALVLFAVIVLAGCQSLPGSDGRYADFDRGRSNTRAALTSTPTLPLM